MKSISSQGISRRRFIASVGAGAAAIGFTPHRLFAEKESLVVRARKSAATANITVSKYALAFDHTDGNEWMHLAGATITGHENTRKHLSATTRVDDWDFTFPASPAGAIPTDVFNGDKTFRLNGATIALKYYGPSHTDGDISVYFTEADVLHTGDTWWNGHFPFIDYSTGGNINGMIKAAEANLAMASDRTIVVPGHGPVAGKNELTEYRDLLLLIRDRVAALKKAGKSLDEIVAAKVTAAYEAKWGGFFINGDFFTRLVYKGLTD